MSIPIRQFKSDIIDDNFDGYILSAPMHSTVTYLIDKNGTVIHTWPSEYIPGQSVYMLDDGSILRTIRLSPLGAGTGGGRRTGPTGLCRDPVDRLQRAHQGHRCGIPAAGVPHLGQSGDPSARRVLHVWSAPDHRC